MRRPLSLTLRMTLLFGIATVIVFSGFGWLIEQSINRHFRNEDTSELRVIANSVAKILAPGKRFSKEELSQRFADILVGHHSAKLFLIKQDGTIIYTSANSPDLSKISSDFYRFSSDNIIQRWNDKQHTYRILTRKLENASGAGAYLLAVAVGIDYHQRFIDKFRLTLWITISSGILIMGILGFIVVRQGHTPLRNMISQIRRISANELNTRLSPDIVPRELADLALSFNEMLARMENAFQRLSNFSADIAHELRTPITNLLTQTQVALSQSRSESEYREILYSNIEEYERIAQMINDMLFLAKTDNGTIQPNLRETDLAREIETLFEYYEAWAEECGINLTLQGNLTLQCDKLMIRRAISNLLSNAIRHTPAKNTVRVKLEDISGQLGRITVANPGSSIPPETATRIFDRFYRLEASKHQTSEGTGLGLAIVKSIVDFHNGKIELRSQENLTCFIMTLPKHQTIRDEETGGLNTLRC